MAPAGSGFDPASARSRRSLSSSKSRPKARCRLPGAAPVSARVVHTRPLRQRSKRGQPMRNSKRALPRAISSPSLIGCSPLVFSELALARGTYKRAVARAEVFDEPLPRGIGPDLGMMP